MSFEKKNVLVEESFERIWKLDEKHSLIGQGGTKSAYLIDPEIVIVTPNNVDGEELIRIWPRIVKEEMFISNLLQRLHIPTLELNKCCVEMDGRILPSYSSRSFQSYINDGIYIIDTKNIKSTQWPHDNSLSLFAPGTDKYNIDSWMKVLSTAVQDISILAKNGLGLSSDSLNLAFVSKNSKWHSKSSLLFEIRLFAFDFSNKKYPQNLKSPLPLPTRTICFMLEHLVKISIWEEIVPNAIQLGEKEVNLVNVLLLRIKDNIVESHKMEEKKTESIILIGQDGKRIFKK